MMRRRATKCRFNGGDITRVGLASFRRFFLKCVQHVDRLLKPNYVNRPERVGIELAHHFENTCTSAVPRLRGGWQSPTLCQIQPAPEVTSHSSGISHSASRDEPTQWSGLRLALPGNFAIAIILVLV